ncbi:MAG: hypothetical protein ABSF26_02705 [Thermoguttaceae bacterium]|jgi:ATP-dependent DNA ligase
MADNYLQFSECLDNLTAKESQWLAEQLAEVPDTGCPAFLLDYEDREPDDMDCGFQHEFEGTGKHRSLWLSAEERGDVERVAHLVRKFLKRFRPNEFWSLTYATTCSKLRIGEFGGGAVFVTADEIQRQSAHGFVEDRTRSFQRHGDFARLVEKAKTLGIVSEDLDDAVHDAASVPASEINNGSLDEQIAFLVEQLGPEETAQIIDGVGGKTAS